MSWDGVPWAVGGGSAEITADTGRMLVDAIFGGQEGVRSSLHLRVLELATPGAQIRVQPGACVIVNRASGVAYDNQSYAARLPTEDVVDVTPTDAGGGRSDLVVVRVENPHIAGEGWGIPDDAVHGPYIFTRVLENVPANTTSVHQLGLGYSAISLARIDIPSSTATITQGMITDLRSVVNPLTGAEPPPDGETGEAYSKVQTYVRKSINEDDVLNDSDAGGPYRDWPIKANINVAIPSWATKCTYDVQVTNLVVGAPEYRGMFGDSRVNIGNGTIITDFDEFDFDGASTTHSNVSIFMAGELDIPPAIRGTVQNVKVQSRVYDSYHALSEIQADANTKTRFEFNFRNTPSYT